MQNHYLNRSWNIVNWTPRNKFHWNFNQNSHIFIQENPLENVWKMAANLFRPQIHISMGSWHHYIMQLRPAQLAMTSSVSKHSNVMQSCTTPLLQGLLQCRWSGWEIPRPFLLKSESCHDANFVFSVENCYDANFVFAGESCSDTNFVFTGESCYDANFTITGGTTPFGATSDDKVGIMITLCFSIEIQYIPIIKHIVCILLCFGTSLI